MGNLREPRRASGFSTRRSHLATRTPGAAARRKYRRNGQTQRGRRRCGNVRARRGERRRGATAYAPHTKRARGGRRVSTAGSRRAARAAAAASIRLSPLVSHAVAASWSGRANGRRIACRGLADMANHPAMHPSRVFNRRIFHPGAAHPRALPRRRHHHSCCSDHSRYGAAAVAGAAGASHGRRCAAARGLRAASAERHRVV
mmetsp:Transcript_17445/g.52422  ORF Transcript_17445/g.52422 Transcript_17445/m.52422 type:complete len:202 (-) Transcript_17445:1869-2474(-)